MSSSLNLLVDSMDDRYVVRVHRPHITPRRLGAIQQAQGVLLAGGVPCALPVPTLHGAAWVNLAGRLVEVEAYVDHDAVMNSWPRLEAGMVLLARTPRFASHLEPADVAEAVRYRADLGLGTDRCLAAPGAMAEELAGLVAQAEGGLVARLPRQLVHGDFWDDNMLFRHGRPVLLCDFDFMGERARVDDLALTLWCAAATSAMRAPRRRSVLGWAAWSPPTTPAWTCPGGRACRAAAGDGSPAPVVDRWLGGAPGRSGGGARPRRQRRTRVGRGTAAHDRVGPLARHVRLSRTPRPPWPRHPGRTSTGLGDQVMPAGPLSPTGDTSGASLTATAGRNQEPTRRTP